MAAPPATGTPSPSPTGTATSLSFPAPACPDSGYTSPACWAGANHAPPVASTKATADIASLALDSIAADEYEIVADGLSRQAPAGLVGGVAALYPGLPHKPA